MRSPTASRARTRNQGDVRGTLADTPTLRDQLRERTPTSPVAWAHSSFNEQVALLPHTCLPAMFFISTNIFNGIYRVNRTDRASRPGSKMMGRRTRRGTRRRRWQPISHRGPQRECSLSWRRAPFCSSSVDFHWWLEVASVAARSTKSGCHTMSAAPFLWLEVVRIDGGVMWHRSAQPS